MDLKENISKYKTRLKKDNIVISLNRIVQRPILTNALLLLIISIFLLLLSIPMISNNPKHYIEGILIEAHGVLFDLAFIGILLLWLQKNGEKQQRIRRYLDELDDFRYWKSEESAYRAMGNVKRLNRDGIVKIDLSHSYLVNTNLNYVNLSESNLNSANLSKCNLISSIMVNARLNQASLEECSMNNSDLSGSFLSGANFSNSSLIKANLSKANCIMSNFENAFLMEADLRGANLLGTNFKNTNLYKTDLRNVKGLTLEQIQMAKTVHKVRLNGSIAKQVKEQLPELEIDYSDD